MHVVLVSHAHWDREWYKTFEAFRARLVDLIDRVLDLADGDPGFRFHLDGQTIVVEDYLALRPARRDALAAAVRAGRIAIGPWWVQPDSLLPSGEAHVRNLLEGRRVGAALGPVSAVAYCPDSFGHPAQFPQLFRGFRLGPFVYWRGNGDEIDALPSEWTWEAPDGSTVGAHVLRQGYFSAAGLPTDVDAAAAWAEGVARELAASSPAGIVLLMNGFDHALPEPHAGAVAAALARRTGWAVARGTLDDFAALVPRESPRFGGELAGGRLANLLPGVWSARLPLKLRNRRCETRLSGWAEPWAALAWMLGAADERPALRTAWRALLQNQAHDSIGGCSQDRVHAQMLARYDTADELAAETTTRALERIAGLGPERRSPWSEAFDVAVFNPSPHPRTDLVRVRPVPRIWIEWRGDGGRQIALHPWIPMALGTQGMTADGRPARLVADRSDDRIQVLPDVPALAIECVVADVPAYGWTRVRLAPSGAHPDHEDEGREITTGDLTVRALEDGTLTFRVGAREYSGLGALEDVGDRGDTYDADPVPGNVTMGTPVVRRRLHATGVQELEVDRVLTLPLALAADRTARDAATVPEVVRTTVRLIPGTGRVDLDVRVENLAHDHRLRLLFPTGAPVETFHAATTFDVAVRSTRPRAICDWVHPAPATFPQQGFVTANDLTVAAPGLPEAEVTADGTIAITLVRAVGWLARMDLTTRPQPAGPAMAVPDAQCVETIEASLALFVGIDAQRAADAELGLWGVPAGDAPLAAEGQPLLAVEPPDVIVSALKPAEDGQGVVLRLLNPTDHPRTARVTLGIPVDRWTPLRLDETPEGSARPIVGAAIAIVLPPHALRTVRLSGRRRTPADAPP